MENWMELFTLAVTYLLVFIGDVSSQVPIDYDWNEMHCPEDGAEMMKNKVPWGTEGRAYKTLPKGLVIAQSNIEGAGFGVFADTFIPKFTWLGEYDGDVIKLKYKGTPKLYSWWVHRNGKATALVDGYHLHLSSYHRYVNAPMLHRDQNVLPLECYGRIYYVTSRDIYPSQELLVYYGHSYTLDLGIDINTYFDVPDSYMDLGLDLNNGTHRDIVEITGFDLFEIKELPLNWIYHLIDKMLK